MLKCKLAGAVGLIGFLLLASAVPITAQTNGGIIGVVADVSGAVLSCVTVTATGAALQVPSIVDVSDAKGEYRLSPLPPGTYTVTFELSGFQTVKREDVRLALGFTATLDQALGLGSLQETVTVSGASPLVDVTNPATPRYIASFVTAPGQPTVYDDLLVLGNDYLVGIDDGTDVTVIDRRDAGKTRCSRLRT